jgi:hypothetical protein
MKLRSKAVEMTCTLELTEKETEMLAWLAGYGGTQIASAINVKITSRFLAAEWDALWSRLRGELERQHKLFQDTRQVFTGHKQAAAIVAPEGGHIQTGRDL